MNMSPSEWEGDAKICDITDRVLGRLNGKPNLQRVVPKDLSQSRRNFGLWAEAFKNANHLLARQEQSSELQPHPRELRSQLIHAFSEVQEASATVKMARREPLYDSGSGYFRIKANNLPDSITRP